MSIDGRQEYDFTTDEGKQKFIEEHVEANEDIWLSQVKKMESDHTAITYEDAKKYNLLERLQNTLDNIKRKLTK